MTVKEIISKKEEYSNFKINQLCKIKKYLKIVEKKRLMDEFENILHNNKRMIDEYGALYIEFIFQLLAVKYYTNIDVELNFDDFDLLQENELMYDILEYINNDYSVLRIFALRE